MKYELGIKNKIFFFIFLCSIFFLFPAISFASSINLSEAMPTSLSDVNTEFQVKVGLSINADDGTKYFLRGVFFKAGSNNYCGYTWNGNSWYNGPFSAIEGWKNLPSVSISSNSAVLVLKAKIDPQDSGCRETGEYKFKIQRYTEAGSASFDGQNEQSINISFFSFTPTPIKIPTATTKPTVTEAVSTYAPIRVTIQPTLTQTIITASQTFDRPDAEIIQEDEKINNEQARVLGQTVISDNNTQETHSTDNNKSSLHLVTFFITVGTVCIILSVYFSIKGIRKKQDSNSFS